MFYLTSVFALVFLACHSRRESASAFVVAFLACHSEAKLRNDKPEKQKQPSPYLRT
jgi:hypothetical protein